MSLAQLPLDAINPRITFDCRFRRTKSHLNRLLQAPKKLPPVVVFHEPAHDGRTHYHLADGGYRYEAAARRGLDTLEVELRPGGEADAVLHACQANERHGVPRSSADKRDAILRLVGNPHFSDRSNAWIAEQCQVSAMSVGRLRRSLGQSPELRQGRDGKVRRLPEPAPPAEPPLSSRDRALNELAKARAELDQAIQAIRHSGGEKRESPHWKTLKKLRAARQEVLQWASVLERSPPEPPIPDPHDTSPAGIQAAEEYRIRRLPPRDLLGMMKKVISHDREMIGEGTAGEGAAGRGTRDEGRGARERQGARSGGGRPPTPQRAAGDAQPEQKRAKRVESPREPVTEGEPPALPRALPLLSPSGSLLPAGRAGEGAGPARCAATSNEAPFRPVQPEQKRATGQQPAQTGRGLTWRRGDAEEDDTFHRLPSSVSSVRSVDENRPSPARDHSPQGVQPEQKRAVEREESPRGPVPERDSPALPRAASPFSPSGSLPPVGRAGEGAGPARGITTSGGAGVTPVQPEQKRAATLLGGLERAPRASGSSNASSSAKEAQRALQARRATRVAELRAEPGGAETTRVAELRAEPGGAETTRVAEQSAEPGGAEQRAWRS